MADFKYLKDKDSGVVRKFNMGRKQDKLIYAKCKKSVKPSLVDGKLQMNGDNRYETCGAPRTKKEVKEEE